MLGTIVDDTKKNDESLLFIPLNNVFHNKHWLSDLL